MNLDSYTINDKTLAIVPISRKKSKVYENQNIIIVVNILAVLMLVEKKELWN